MREIVQEFTICAETGEASKAQKGSRGIALLFL